MNIVLMTTFHKRPDSPQNLSRGRDGNGLLGTMKNVNCMEPDPGTSPSVQGDDFRASYAESLPHVYGYLLRRVGGNAALAEDLTQETYVAAVTELVRRRQPVILTVPWLVGVARHKLVDHFRRQAREERQGN